MSGQPTVLGTGGATVTSSGIYTGQGLNQVQAVINAAGVGKQVTLVTPNVVPPLPSGGTGYVLIIPNGVNAGAITVPTGYAVVQLGAGSQAVVSSADPTLQIVSGGVLNYVGNASLLDLSGGIGNVSDAANLATFDIGGGMYAVTAGGNQQTIQVDNAFGNTTVVATGIQDTVRLGDGSAAGGGQYFPGTPGAVTTLNIQGSAAAVTVNGVDFLIVGNTGAGSNSIIGVYGSSTIFAGNNDVYDARGNAAVTEFIGTGSTQTVFGGTGADIVFGGVGQITYNEGTGNGRIFVGGIDANSQAVVNSNSSGSGAIFGGLGHTQLNLALGSQDVFVGGGQGGNDTINAALAIPTVFGGSNETVSIVGSTFAYAVAVGQNNVIDASASNGNTNFFALASQGNATLIGSSAPADTFNIATAPGAQVHTVLIQGWSNGDGLFLSGYSAADVQTMANAINGGGSTFTLSDGTTVTFQGEHPTYAQGTGAF